MSRNMADDLFTAYQEAAKVMSAKNGSSSRTVSGDEVKITGSGGVTTQSVQQSADIARFAGSLAMVFSNLNLKVFPQDGIVLFL